MLVKSLVLPMMLHFTTLSDLGSCKTQISFCLLNQSVLNLKVASDFQAETFTAIIRRFIIRLGYCASDQDAYFN